MAFRKVTVMEVKEVLRLWLLGHSRRGISQQLSLARNTVRKVIAAGIEERMSVAAGPSALTDERLVAVLRRLDTRQERARGTSWETCLARRSFIETHIKQGLRLTKVQRLLERHGASVPYATLHRFAREVLDFGHAPATVPLADGAPGSEVQLDTGWMTQLEPTIDGQRRRFRAFIFTAVHSRHRFVYPSLRETTADSIAACEAAWRFFGGVFAVVIIDNTKAIVNRADPLGALLVPAFLEYAQARGFVVDTARVRHPKDKARVERNVQDVREDCFRGERLATITEARTRAITWCRNEIGMRKHTRTGRMPLEHFEAVERAQLLPLPTDLYDVPEFCTPKVAPDQFAQVKKALYAMPRELRGKTLLARADSQTVRFYLGAKLVKVCPRVAPGQRYFTAEDFPAEQTACAQRDVAFLVKKAQSHGPEVGRFGEKLLAGPLPWTRMRRLYALLGLCRRYGDERVNTMCGVALAEEMHDVRRLQRMLERAVLPQLSRPGSGGQVIALARYVRDPKQYALPLTSGGPGDRPKPHGDES